jgi:CcmD family protein
MSDLIWATLTILLIWGGIFIYLLGLDRRLRRLERALTGSGKEAD